MTELRAWDLAQVFADERAALSEARVLPDLSRALAERAGEIGPTDALPLLDELGALEERVATLDDYARMRQYADAADAEGQQITAAGQAAAAAANAALAEVWDALSSLAPELLESIVASPQLEPARHRLRRAAALRRHRLAPEAERAWAAREESGRVRWGSLHEQIEAGARIAFDDGTGERLWSLGSLWGVTRRPTADVRRRGYAAVADLFGSVADVVAVCWDAAVADRLAEDRLRGRAHPAQATLDDQELTLAGFESLVAAVWSRLPVRHRLIRRQEALLGVAPIETADADGEPPGLPPISLEGAWTTAVMAIGELGAALAEQAAELRATGRVDLDDRPGKQPYAVTFCTSLDPPAFLSSRFSGRAGNVTTIGHELGHASALGAMRRAQPPIARGWPGVVFEVPSLLCEIATGDAMVAAADAEHRPGLRLAVTQDLAWSVFEAIAFCRVELDLYAARAAGQVLTAERILDAFRKHVGALFRPVCDFDERDALVFMAAWASYATGSHYRFYNFQYAVGALCALALMVRRQGDESQFAADLTRFLSFGRSASPAEQLSVFRVELGSRQLWEEGLDAFEARVAAI